MTTNNRVSLRFIYLSDSALDEFAANNVVSLTGNLAYPNLPVEPADLGALRVTFHEGILAALSGDTQLIAGRNEAREALLTALRNDAAYVQSIAGQNLALLLTSGFKAVSTNRTPSPLAMPVILNVDNQSSTQLGIALGKIANAAAYQVKLTTAQGVVVAVVESTRARKITVANLTPGTTYTVVARAIGGSTGYSDWSLPTSIMAT